MTTSETSKYYVNKNKDDGGHHEVHKGDCPWLPNAENREYLGEFYYCQSAVTEAKKRGYDPVDGHKYCSPECHTR